MDKKEIDYKIKIWGEILNLAQTNIDTYSQLESEKPVLRHGDYGIDSASDDDLNWFYFHDTVVYQSGCTMRNPNQCRLIKERIGNIFDDMQAMSEDLEEFEIKLYNDNIFQIEHSTRIGKDIRIAINGSGLHLIMEQAQEIHRKLGQLIATKKRKAAKE